MRNKRTVVGVAGVFGVLILVLIGFFVQQILTRTTEVIIPTASPSSSVPTITLSEHGLRIINLRIGLVELEAEIALTPVEQAKGLGGRGGLGLNSGMLFPMSERRVPGFWMEGMLIPLDIIWIDGEDVVGFEENISVPETGESNSSLPTYSPTQPVTAVLEVNSGFVQKMGVKIGDKVVIENFNPSI